MDVSQLARVLPLAFLLTWGGAPPAPADDRGAERSGELTVVELLRLRERPSTESRQMALLLQGERLEPLERRELWYRVRTRFGVGWVYGDYVREAGGTEWAQHEVHALPAPARVAEGVSLRSRPSVDAPRRAVLPAGALLIVDRVDGAWLHVTSSAGSGWVHDGSIATVGSPAAESAPAEPRRRARSTAAEEFRVVPELEPEPPALPFVDGFRRPLLAVWLPNAARVVIVRALEAEDGGIWLPAEQLSEFRLDPSRLASMDIAGGSYVELDAIEGLTYELDPASQRLKLDLDPTLLRATRVDIRPTRFMPPSRSEPGAVLNYDLVGTSADGVGAADSSLSGQFDLRVFGRFGTVSHLMVASDAADERRLTRLLTTWRIDRPERMRTLLVGDSTTPSGLWWRAAQLAGVQWRSNFATRPGFLPYPQPTVSGEAIWPSEIEIYLGEVLRERRSVPAGPFEIRNIPVVSGQGDFTYVVRDALGREVATARSFYTEPTLLKRGLSEFSFTLGALRERPSEASFDYGDVVGAGSYRRGLSDRLTFESHGEILSDRGAAGAGVSALLPRLGSVQIGAAASRRAGESGSLLSYGYSYNGKGLSVAISGETADRGFWRLGEVVGLRTRRSFRGRVGQSLRRVGVVSLVYASRTREGGDRLETTGLHLSARLSERFILQVSGLETDGLVRERYATFLLTRLIGRRRTASVTSTIRDGTNYRSGVRYQQAAPFGPGLGFSLAAEGGEDDRVQASVALRTGRGDLRIESAASDDRLSLRPSWSGSLVAVGGGLYTSRVIGDSFGLARTGGVPDVRVYHENRLVGRTDAKGRLLVPSLLPYQPNKLRAELDDLPIRAIAGNLDLEVSPYSESGLLVDFPIDLRASALVRLAFEDGRVVPAGALVVDEVSGATFPVALDGLAHLTGLGKRHRYSVHWQSVVCGFELDLATDLNHQVPAVCVEGAE